MLYHQMRAKASAYVQAITSRSRTGHSSPHSLPTSKPRLFDTSFYEMKFLFDWNNTPRCLLTGHSARGRLHRTSALQRPASYGKESTDGTSIVVFQSNPRAPSTWASVVLSQDLRFPSVRVPSWGAAPKYCTLGHHTLLLAIPAEFFSSSQVTSAESCSLTSSRIEGKSPSDEKYIDPLASTAGTHRIDTILAVR